MKEPGSPPVRVMKSAGRPKVAERLEVVSTRVDSITYASLVRSAQMQDISVSSLVRHLLILRLPKE